MFLVNLMAKRDTEKNSLSSNSVDLCLLIKTNLSSGQCENEGGTAVRVYARTTQAVRGEDSERREVAHCYETIKM